MSDARRRRQLTVALGRAGYRVTALHTGVHLLAELAEALFDDDAPRPDGLVVDAVLPGCTGLSVVEGLRELGWRVPAVVLAPPSSRTRTTARRLGQTTVLDRRTIAPRVATALSRALDRRVLRSNRIQAKPRSVGCRNRFSLSMSS